jgi:hypothetical protein
MLVPFVRDVLTDGYRYLLLGARNGDLCEISTCVPETGNAYSMMSSLLRS